MRAPSEVSCPILDPLVLLDEDNALRLDLCDLLEHIADALPENAAPQLAQLAATAIARGWVNHTTFEEQALFPVLRRYGRSHPELAACIAQLASEHVTDVAFDQELIDTLIGLARGGSPTNPNMVGYLLRSHFVPMRRHVLWENALLIPAARRLLSTEEISVLREWIRDREPDHYTCGWLG